ncbi:MAG TPA: bifunctional serine/threonine-protein kinase/formylglycine-generating enzyme family protein [Planctomycetota bacterium]|nr:bifunctional serine/threonine-protein kinase/formylglycine-generating enzyme family protein [Planctomycetota bacterium]
MNNPSDPTSIIATSEAQRLTALAAQANADGSHIGPYKILQELGEGGMGTVYLAEQIEPVKRRVALKIIKSGLATGYVIARFDIERQALAMMDHPNIAKVLDAGTTQDGQPYFVMELVSGVPITKYCDNLQLPLRARLELFIPVCYAIQHAHQKGIIHRDIKPSNVLVAMQDGKPVPKVIDFGVAKAVNQKLTDATMYTQLGVIIGTLEYMSPEQAEMSALGIDSRSDIYSLGAMLYELLTGTTPFDRRTMKDATIVEMLRLIREVEPPKPSTRISSCPDTLHDTAVKRKIEPTRLVQSVSGELDWIVMRALDKDRTRRYDSASGLARDIERYLADEPVEACPPTSWYRFKKMARRNKGLLAACAAIAIILIAATATSISFALRATAAEKAAQAALNEQRRLSLEADVKNAEADDEKGESAKIIQAVEPYLADDLLANYPAFAKAKQLVEKARDGYQRFAALQAKVNARDKGVSLDLGHGVMLELILIPNGKFDMGGTKNANESPRHPVEISNPFYMSKYAVTQEQYEALTGAAPSPFKGKKTNPVESVNWFEAAAFCDKLSKQSGPAKLVFALPTEAQWEYACRAGTTTEYYYGDNEKELTKHAWFATLDKFAWFAASGGIIPAGDVNSGPQPVGLKLANPFGLFDMHGNVLQWCQDWYDENYYSNSPRKDPPGPKDGVLEKTMKTECRVLRGGSFFDAASFCRSACRRWNAPVNRSTSIGFRIVLLLDVETTNRTNLHE